MAYLYNILFTSSSLARISSSLLIKKVSLLGECISITLFSRNLIIRSNLDFFVFNCDVVSIFLPLFIGMERASGVEPVCQIGVQRAAVTLSPHGAENGI